MRTERNILEATIRRCRERDIILPTYNEMTHPEKIPTGIREALRSIGLWDVHPRNLFRIHWKNEPVHYGGGFGGVNVLEIPNSLSGVEARILFLLGKYFPTGSHKVGATFGPLVEKLIRGEFDPTKHKALWPSTGNYCRGGAYDSALLACPSIAVLPEGMSKERFEWLETLGAEVHTVPGGESNVKEVYDRTKEIKAERPDEVVVLNQFEEMGNAVWHYACTGPAMEETFLKEKKEKSCFAGLCLTQGSAGTLGCGEYLRERFPLIKIAAAEALQCPTLLLNGYGEHRIEGIGDKHVPWIHNLKNTDLVIDVDDEDCIRVLRLFNEPAGRIYLQKSGIDPVLIRHLDLLGISGIANLLASIKMAKYYEFNGSAVILTVATDSMELYKSRLDEITRVRGRYNARQAMLDFHECVIGQSIDWIKELTYWDRKRMHNLKYFTWIEQQGKTVEELNAQWNDPDYWTDALRVHSRWDEHIQEFNARTGLLNQYGC